MHCLFVVRNIPLSYMYSGTSCRVRMDLDGLLHNGVKVTVLRFIEKNVEKDINDFESKFPEEKEEVLKRVVEFKDIIVEPSRGDNNGFIKNLISSFIDPIELFYPKTGKKAEFLKAELNRLKPDFVWTGAFDYTNLIGFLGIANGQRWILTQTDWNHRLVKIRNSQNKNSLKKRLLIFWRSYTLKKVTKLFLKKATLIVTGSSLQQKEIKEIVNRSSFLIPQIYPEIDNSVSVESNTSQMNIFHLGSLVTTSNYIGMISYLDKVHFRLIQELGKENVKLKLIGSHKGAKKELIQKLEDLNADFLGFQFDLTKVINPYDIQIIPYEFNTGLRSKIPLLFRSAQVVVTTSAAVMGMPELQHGHNCFILERLEGFVDALQVLFHDEDLRKKIGTNALKTFEEHYCLNSVLPKYSEVINSLPTEG